MIILQIKNEKQYKHVIYSSNIEACRFTEKGFEIFQRINQNARLTLNCKKRFFLGDSSTQFTLELIEGILYFYSGLTYFNLGQIEQARESKQISKYFLKFKGWVNCFDILQNFSKSPYFILVKNKLHKNQSLNSEDYKNLLNYGFQSARQRKQQSPQKISDWLKNKIKVDRVEKKFLNLAKQKRHFDSFYNSGQQSFRLINNQNYQLKSKLDDTSNSTTAQNISLQRWSNSTQNINKNKSQLTSRILGENWINEKLDSNNKKIEFKNYFSDKKKFELQINVKDTSNVTNRREHKPMLNRRYGLDIMEKLNRTHNELYKTYLGMNSSRENQGSKTQRKELNEIDIRIKINENKPYTEKVQSNANSSCENDNKQQFYSPQTNFTIRPNTHNFQLDLKNQVLRSGKNDSLSVVSSGRRGESTYKNQFVHNENKTERVSNISKYLNQHVTKINDIYKYKGKSYCCDGKIFDYEVQQSHRMPRDNQPHSITLKKLQESSQVTKIPKQVITLINNVTLNIQKKFQNFQNQQYLNKKNEQKFNQEIKQLLQNQEVLENNDDYNDSEDSLISVESIKQI